MHALAEKLNLALADLGDTPDAIAAYLEGQGITGTPMKAGRCPVAKYVMAIGPFNWVSVACRRVTAATPDRPGRWHRTDLSPAVAEFVSRFDGGHYPALEAK